MATAKKDKDLAAGHAKKEKILAWLSSDEMEGHRRDFRAGNGFSVNERDHRVEVDGQVISMTEFLQREGFEHGDVVGEFRVVWNEAKEQFPESFAFFLMAPVKAVPEFSGNGNRQAEIVGWLKSDDMQDVTRAFQNDRGFSVNERCRVNAAGKIIPITKYLKDEGFVDGAIIDDNYRIRVNPAKGQFPENLSFFLLGSVVAVPSF